MDQTFRFLFSALISSILFSPLASADDWTDGYGSGTGWQFKEKAPKKVKLGICDEETVYCVGYVLPDDGDHASVICRANADGSCPSATDCGANDNTVKFSRRDVKSIEGTGGGSKDIQKDPGR